MDQITIEVADTNEISDGFHTFGELYETVAIGPHLRLARLIFKFKAYQKLSYSFSSSIASSACRFIRNASARSSSAIILGCIRTSNIFSTGTTIPIP